MKTVIFEAGKPRGLVTWRELVAELKQRHDSAFSVLNAQVEAAKQSPSVQITTGVTIVGLLFSGRWASAAGLAGAWIGSRPLVHVAAGGVACVGMLDVRVKAAVQRSKQGKRFNKISENCGAARQHRRADTEADREPVGG
jgi:hypothetical protein